MLHRLKQCSGSKINSSKTDAMWLGKDKRSKEELYDIRWPSTPTIALGAAFSHDNKPCGQKNVLE